MAQITFDKIHVKLDNRLVELVEMDHAKYLFASAHSANLEGNPTVDTPDGSNSKSIVNVEYVDSKLGGIDSMRYMGVLNSGDSLPVGKLGDTYKVGSTGSISGIEVHVGDLFICKSDTRYDVPDNWDLVCINDSDDLIGPSKSMNEGIVVFDGTSGRLIKDSGLKISDLMTDITLVSGSGLIKSNGSIGLGTPSTCDRSSTNNVSESSHTHEIKGFLADSGKVELDGRLYTNNYTNVLSPVEIELSDLDKVTANESNGSLGIIGLDNLGLGLVKDDKVDPTSMSILSIHSIKLLIDKINKLETDLSNSLDTISKLEARLSSVETELVGVNESVTKLENAAK